MKLIVGLGNPGDRYNFTRHNFGFLALDFYAKACGLEWQKTPKNGAIWLQRGKNYWLKPQGFYNNSGVAVGAWMRYYKLTAKDVLVICDDFNLPFGEMRYREKGSAGGNNGLKSMIGELGTEDFARLRLGTGSELRKKMDDTDFVLGRFTEEERGRLAEVLRGVGERVEEWGA